VEQFVHIQNLTILRKQLAETANEPKRRQILLLLAEEESKVQWPSDREKKATDGSGRFVMLGVAV
jgi:DNA-binding transcriptional ArsR family regulator